MHEVAVSGSQATGAYDPPAAVYRWMRYPATGVVGAVQDSVTCPFPATAASPVGAGGEGVAIRVAGSPRKVYDWASTILVSAQSEVRRSVAPADRRRLRPVPNRERSEERRVGKECR